MDEAPITSGQRFSVLGYTNIPEISAFDNDPLFVIFSSKPKPTGQLKLTEANLN